MKTKEEIFEEIVNDMINSYNNNSRIRTKAIIALTVEYNKFVQNKTRPKAVKKDKIETIYKGEREPLPKYKPIIKENKYQPYKFS